jgi:fructokinase
MILISGEALIDLIPDPVKLNAYDAVLGGSPYNVAIGLARLGSQTGFVSRISADGNGEALAASLADNGVDLAFVQRDKRPSTLAFVMRGTARTGSRYSFYLDATCFDGPWPFPATWPKGARHLHVGSISAVDPRHGEGVVEALKTARRHGTASYDPNIRPLVTPDRASVATLVERQASLSHFVKASEEDLHWLYPGRSVEQSLAAWAATGPRFCVATLGERGALAMLGRERVEILAPRIEVVDTVGAGDSFMSALLSAMDQDSALGADAGSPSRGVLERWLRFAAAASAITCTRKGSDPPTRNEVELALRGGKKL